MGRIAFNVLIGGKSRNRPESEGHRQPDRRSYLSLRDFRNTPRACCSFFHDSTFHIRLARCQASMTGPFTPDPAAYGISKGEEPPTRRPRPSSKTPLFCRANNHRFLPRCPTKLPSASASKRIRFPEQKERIDRARREGEAANRFPARPPAPPERHTRSRWWPQPTARRWRSKQRTRCIP